MPIVSRSQSSRARCGKYHGMSKPISVVIITVSFTIALTPSPDIEGHRRVKLFPLGLCLPDEAPDHAALDPHLADCAIRVDVGRIVGAGGVELALVLAPRRSAQRCPLFIILHGHALRRFAPVLLRRISVIG